MEQIVTVGLVTIISNDYINIVLPKIFEQIQKSQISLDITCKLVSIRIDKLMFRLNEQISDCKIPFLGVLN